MRLNHYRVGNGEQLVLIHGIGSEWQVWQPVLGALAQEREVVALDLPGFAASPMPPPGTPAGLDSMTELLIGFFDELGLERPHVAGNSLGGWLALELAKRGRARTATALSPAGFHNSTEAVYQRNMFKVSVAAARWMAPRAESFVGTPFGRALALGMFVAKPANLPAAGAADAIRTLAGAQWFDATLAAFTHDHFKDGERIDVPTTIAWAERDRVLLPRQAPRAAAAVPIARNLTLIGCGHVPTFDDPDQVTRVILEGSRT